MVLEDEMNWPTLEICCGIDGRDMPCMSSCGRIRGVPLAPDKDGSIPDEYIILGPLHLAVYFGLGAFCQTLLRADASLISHKARGLPGLGKEPQPDLRFRHSGRQILSCCREAVKSSGIQSPIVADGGWVYARIAAA